MSDWKIIVSEAGTNLWTNPSVETNTTGYSAAGSNTIAKSSTQSRYGANSLLCTYVDSSVMARMPFTFSAAGTYNILLSVYIASQTGGTTLKINPSGYTSSSVVTASTTTDSQGEWVDLEITVTIDSGDLVGEIWLQYNTSPSAAAVYLDGVNITEATYSTTHIDGDQPGCKWNGTPHASTSTRDQFEAAGGRVYDLSDDLNFVVADEDGVGMPPVNNLSSPLALQPGDLFDGQTIRGRTVIYTGSIIGDDKADFHSKRQALVKALNANTKTVGERSQPRTFRYTGAAVDKEFYAVYDGGLEFGLANNDGFGRVGIPLRLKADDPLYYQIGESAAALDVNDSTTFRTWAGRVDGTWDALGPPDAAGTYTRTYAITKAYGELVLGGIFTNFDNIAAADYIVKWDGSSYSALGSGADGNVVCLTVGPDGALYAGGAFTTMGGVACRGVAKWNGSAWSALGPPSSGGQVNTMLFDHDGVLWIGGSFTNWDGTAAADYIATWDGSSWSAVGTGADGDVNGLAIDSLGDIYATGAFANINSVAAARVAKYDGSTWTALSTGISGTGNAAVVDANGNLYVGFNGTTAGGVTVNYVAKWNGQAWSDLESGMSGQVVALAISPDGELYAGGYFTTIGNKTITTSMAIWNGSTWRALDHTLGGSVLGTAPYFDDGNFYYGFNAAAAIAHSGNATVSYSGTYQAYPYIKIKRSGGTSATLQEITNYTTGAGLYFNYALLDGETLTIDTRPGKQTISSSIKGEIFSELLPNSDFGRFFLMPGNGTGDQDNLITAYVQEAGTPTMTANMIWRDAYISED